MKHLTFYLCLILCIPNLFKCLYYGWKATKRKDRYRNHNLGI